jgi:hypothetical protein
MLETPVAKADESMRARDSDVQGSQSGRDQVLSQ